MHAMLDTLIENQWRLICVPLLLLAGFAKMSLDIASIAAFNPNRQAVRCLWRN